MMEAEEKGRSVLAGPDGKNSDDSDSTTAPPSNPVHGALVGSLAKLTSNGVPYVSYTANGVEKTVAARSITPLPTDAIGKEVALLFEHGAIDRPIVIGIIQQAATTAVEHEQITADESVDKESDSFIILDDTISTSDSELVIDGRKIDLQAREQIVLRCGKSSITMTHAGKVIIRGAYVSSKSSGANRIKGGSVQIN